MVQKVIKKLDWCSKFVTIIYYVKSKSKYVAPTRARGRGRGRGRGRKASRVIESDEEISPEQPEQEEVDAPTEEKPLEEPTPVPAAEEKENDIHPPTSMFTARLRHFF